MSKYQSYSCSNLLEYFDSWYEHDTDRTNYAQYLLTMQDASSVKDMIGIYDKVLWKFIVRYHGIGKEELVSELWYNINMLSCDTRVYWESLNVFLNENIKRLFDSQEYSDKLAFECITNLREASNCAKIRKYFFSQSSESVAANKEKILSSLDVVNKATEHITPYNIDTNGYLVYKSKYIENIKYLISIGFIKSIKDITFELNTNISYISDRKGIGKFFIFMIVMIPIAILLIYAIGKASIFVIIILALFGIVWKGR